MLKRGLLLFFVLLIPCVSAVSVEKVEIQDKEVVITIQGKVSNQIEFFKDGLSKGTYKLCEDSICDFVRKELRVRLSNTGINEIGDYVLRIQEIDSDGQAAVQSHNLIITNDNLDVCTDGTLNNACSSTKPLFCDNGKLTEKCGKGTFTYYTNNLELGITTRHETAKCGDCPTGKTCQTDGSCKEFVLVEEEKNTNKTEPNKTEEEIVCIKGDLDSNGKVDVFDLLAILKVLGGATNSKADINSDGKTDIIDLLALLNLIGKEERCEEVQEWETTYDVRLDNEIPPFVAPNTKFDLKLGITIYQKRGEEERKDLPDEVYLLIDGNRINPNEDTQYQFLIDTSLLAERENPYEIFVNFIFEGKLYQEKVGQFTIDSEEHCLEVIPGHNNPDDESRMNVVFVGLGYSGVGTFKEYVDMSVGFDGEGDGIFSLEPFKSNKDKFNLWYVDIIGVEEDNLNFDVILVEDLNLNSVCLFSNKVTNAFFNSDFRSHAFFGGGSIDSFPELSDVNSNRVSVRTVVHEFGHGYGYLFDEYTEHPGVFNQIIGKNCFSKGVDVGDPDCMTDLDYCIDGDGYCILGCNPVDRDCIIEPTCGVGDGCLNRVCETHDPDCNKDLTGTCSGGDLCVKNCEPEDPDCSRDGCNFDGICISNCISNEKRLDPDCISKTCNEGNGCVIGCTIPDKDCDGVVGCQSGKCGGNGIKEPTCSQGDGCKGGCAKLMTKEECYNEAPWKDLLGKGIGNGNNKIGFRENLGICTDGSQNCYLDIDCWQGCNYLPYNIYRATFNSIMRNQYLNPYSYGSVNERLICQKIKDNMFGCSTILNENNEEVKECRETLIQLGDSYCTPNFGI
ncbi:MAG: dockerin type I domain-containing protein [Nanoarchaeota archaeon]